MLPSRSRQKTLFFAPLLALVAGCVAATEPSGGGSGDHDADEALLPGAPGLEVRLLVQARAGASDALVKQTVGALGAKVEGAITPIRVSVLRVPEGAAASIAAALDASGVFTFVERDVVGAGTGTPNDPRYGQQWHHAKVRSASAWDTTVGSSGVAVAVLDSGVDAGHPDLSGKVLPGWDFVGDDSNPADDHGHGTAVAGASAARGDNGVGVAGVSWASPILPLKVLDANNYGYYSDWANAIVYAADEGVRVINLSLGGTSASSTLQSAVTYAWNKGALVVVSAGNASTSSPLYPAACDNALAVGATESDDTLASFSNHGDWVDLTAPGRDILTTMPGGYGTWWGTSFAAPLVSGVAALVLSARPTLSNSELASILKSSAVDLGPAGFDSTFGWGRLDAAAAVASASTEVVDAQAPVVQLEGPADGATVAGTVHVAGTASDEEGVTKVELYVDAQQVAEGTAGNFDFTWDTTGVTNGAHAIWVRAYDAAGNVGTREASVHVENASPETADTSPPQIAITSPGEGSQLPRRVTVSASASDDRGVAQVSFYVDGVLRHTDLSAPYAFTWRTTKASPGKHVIAAKAWDAAGNVTSAQPVTVYK